jgi:hypothetical protein
MLFIVIQLMDLHLVEVMIFAYQTNQTNQAILKQILAFLTNIQTILMVIRNLGQDSLEIVQITISKPKNTKYIK